MDWQYIQCVACILMAPPQGQVGLAVKKMMDGHMWKMLTHSKVKKQCDWSLFFILTHIAVSKRWSTSISSDEYWVVTASPNTSALLVHPWHHDNCFCLPATVIMTKLLCQSTDCRWLFFSLTRNNMKPHICMSACMCVLSHDSLTVCYIVRWRMFLTKRTIY